MNLVTTTGSDMGSLLNYIIGPTDARLPPGFESTGTLRSNDSPKVWQATKEEFELEERRPRSAGGPNFDEEVNNDLRRPLPSSHWREGRAELIASNMTGRSIRELLEEFRALASLRPDVQVNTRHFILSTPEEDRVTSDTQALIAERFASLMGLDRRMWAAFRHKDHAHDEIHIVTTNSDIRGALPSDSFIYDKAEHAARQLEEEFSLSRNRGSRMSMRRCPTQGELKRFERTGVLGPVIRLQAEIDKLLNKKLSFTEFAGQLEQTGIGLTLLVGEKHVGAIYEFEGKRYRGRRLGRGYTFTGLQREWPDQQERQGVVEYVNERDNAAFSERASQYAARRSTAIDSRGSRTGSNGEASDRGRHSRHSREAGQAGGRSERKAELAGGAEHSSPPNEQSGVYVLSSRTAPTQDAESIRGVQEAVGGRRGGDRQDSAPTTAGDDEHLQIGAGRDDYRVQEIPRADEGRHDESKPSDGNVPPDGRSVQQVGSAMPENGGAVWGQLSESGRDYKRRGADCRRAGEGGGGGLDQSDRRSQTEVPGELPLFDVGATPTSIDDSSRAAEWHPAGSSHQPVDFGEVDRQIFVHNARDIGEGRVSHYQTGLESHQAVDQIEESSWTSTHDAAGATRHSKTDNSDLGIESLDEPREFLPPELTLDLTHHVDEGRRADADDEFSPRPAHEHRPTDELPVPDVGFEDKDTDDFGR